MTADMAVGGPQYIDNDKYIIPDKAELYNNYPNPFNAKTTISFRLLQAANVKINIFDIRGRLVDRLIDENLNAGYHNIEWMGLNDSPNDLSSGIYLYTIIVDNISVFRKMLHLK
jgi:hypothetical protein